MREGRSRRFAYDPALDGVRAVAVLSVLLFHAFSWPRNGALGVSIFFVLSGFLITVLLLGEWEENGAVSLGRFYMRRMLRLFPALGFMLLAFVGGSALLYSVGRLGHAHLLQNAGGAALGASYVSNVVLAWSPASVVPALGHLWSLGMEEQFYVVWPVALVVCLRRRVPPRLLLAVVALAAIVVAAHRAQLALTGASQWHVLFAPDTQCDGILVGCLAGIAWANGMIPQPLRTEASRTWIVRLGGCVVAVSLFLPLSYHAGAAFLLPVFEPTVAVLLLAVLLSPAGGLRRALEQQHLVAIGNVSYGLYLWHAMLFKTLGVTAGLPLAFVLTWLSFRLVETPFLRRKSRLVSPRPPLLIPDARPLGAA